MRFTAISQLPNLTIKVIWDIFQIIQIDIYIGLPNFIITNIEKNFTSKEFAQLAGNININIKTIPIKAYQLIKIIK